MNVPNMDASDPDRMMAELNAYDNAQSNTGVRTEFAQALKELKNANSPIYAIDCSPTAGEMDINNPVGTSMSTREFTGKDSLVQLAGESGEVLQQQHGHQERAGRRRGHHQRLLCPRLRGPGRLGRGVPQDQGPDPAAGLQGRQPERLLQSQAVLGVLPVRAAPPDDRPGPQRQSPGPTARRDRHGRDAGHRRRLASPRRLCPDLEGCGGRRHREGRRCLPRSSTTMSKGSPRSRATG
ncbi:MAG: hypothetical protein M0C28_12170 [Candidatus Moduliflexus flocculans]|nr:hypothetical protein [Candidatus Moduliflexus flocculans]